MNAPFTPPGDLRPVNLSLLIDRIDEAVADETQRLKSDRDFDINASNARKSRYLYELSRAIKALDVNDLQAEHRTGLERLRATLTRNEATIRAHLDAVNEVATLMREAIRTAEADGTYSEGQFGWGR
jgi:response regulator RpfG family c-di-GMP phosphodiesterase